ncbi:MAG: hypothetical protein KJ720_17575 [Proteobacteria bacterium]|nr:hypothetical protein [Pseudomonadota bacterium]MBU1451066.1 hypothetical protein [Pseudomonadota bacterium]MBU2467800.1 hypothetical protein [Pseudomonadota bacterium]MBU2517800.1 hypothetical protein [Pseudomonadota bacterium]
MSRWMQIRVRVEPVYKTTFAKEFPKLYQVAIGLDNSLIGQNPSLMDLVPVVVRLSQEKELAPGLSGAIEHYGPKIVALHRQITEAIGGWKLSDAETLLYELEDNFVSFEKELG